ncbi:hypothetical protein DFJ74DRAFT_770223 [Hyaloraphidium curvatum]|nr:hypothetical protein DFJ74DRAFT_770223 [Hyaloraphidium curvatum]
MATPVNIMRYTAGYAALIGLGMTFYPAGLDKLISAVVGPLGLSAPVWEPATSALAGPVILKLATYYWTAAETNDTAYIRSSAYGRVLISALWALGWYRGLVPDGFAAVFSAHELALGYLTWKGLEAGGKW